MNIMIYHGGASLNYIFNRLHMPLVLLNLLPFMLILMEQATRLVMNCVRLSKRILIFALERSSSNN